MCVPLVDLLNGLLWTGQSGLPPTLNTLHLGCTYLPPAPQSPFFFHFECGYAHLNLKRKKIEQI